MSTEKDIIYIDTEDDITAIIGKIKDSKEKIVALVPPKRIGLLQSAVNLRLLARMAEKSNKRLVLITNNDALIALSATALIPVAKNLQSKPEIAEIAALEIDEGEDVIDGAQLPVGELMKTADLDNVSQKDEEEDDKQDASDDIEDINIEDDSLKSSSKAPMKSVVKVPDFPRFRKKLFLGITLAILLAAFLVWANLYAPSARVIITAKTSPAPVSMAVKLGGTEATDVKTNIIQSISKQAKKDLSVEFSATGTATVGEKAKGSVVFNNCDTSTQETISSGTYISVDTKNYIVQSDAVVAAGTFSGGHCSSAGTSSPAEVIAAAIGADYNVSASTQFLVSGYSNLMTATTTAGLSGGTSHEAKIVTAGDVQKASQVLVDLPTIDAKQQLTAQFTNGEMVIGDSFDVARVAAVSVPAIGAEATTGKAKLTSQATFSITAIAKSELQTFLKDALSKQISDAKIQRVYSDGIDEVVLSGYLKTDLVSTVNIATVGKIGPNIDEASIKEQVKGKRYGDIQSLIGAIEGVSSVDTKFSYFWVTNVPNDVNKIEVEFRLEDA
jgi:hypothetical protein